MMKRTAWFLVAMAMIFIPLHVVFTVIFAAVDLPHWLAWLATFSVWIGIQFAIGIEQYQWGGSPCLSDEELAMAERQAQFSSDRLYIKVTQECRRIRK